MKYTGNLEPNDTLKVDTETGKMLLNNSETYQYSGSLPVLAPNTNTLTYTDSEGSRTISLTVEHQERYE